MINEATKLLCVHPGGGGRELEYAYTYINVDINEGHTRRPTSKEYSVASFESYPYQDRSSARSKTSLSRFL